MVSWFGLCILSKEFQLWVQAIHYMSHRDLPMSKPQIITEIFTDLIGVMGWKCIFFIWTAFGSIFPPDKIKIRVLCLLLFSWHNMPRISAQGLQLNIYSQFSMQSLIDSIANLTVKLQLLPVNGALCELTFLGAIMFLGTHD